MRMCDFITINTGSAVSFSLTVRAQQPVMRVKEAKAPIVTLRISPFGRASEVIA
jgi:hypothetical protein